MLTLGLDKQKENKSVIIYYSLKFLMANLQVERKQGLKDTVNLWATRETGILDLRWTEIWLLLLLTKQISMTWK